MLIYLEVLASFQILQLLTSEREALHVFWSADRTADHELDFSNKGGPWVDMCYVEFANTIPDKDLLPAFLIRDEACREAQDLC